jgi:hypothetical protein
MLQFWHFCFRMLWWLKILKGFGRMWPCHSRSIIFKGMVNTTKVLGQNSRCLGRDSNWAPPEYKSRLLPLEPPIWLLDCVASFMTKECISKDIIPGAVTGSFITFNPWIPALISRVTSRHFELQKDVLLPLINNAHKHSVRIYNAEKIPSK